MNHTNHLCMTPLRRGTVAVALIAAALSLATTAAAQDFDDEGKCLSAADFPPMTYRGDGEMVISHPEVHGDWEMVLADGEAVPLSGSDTAVSLRGQAFSRGQRVPVQIVDRSGSGCPSIDTVIIIG